MWIALWTGRKQADETGEHSEPGESKGTVSLSPSLCLSPSLFSSSLQVGRLASLQRPSPARWHALDCVWMVDIESTVTTEAGEAKFVQCRQAQVQAQALAPSSFKLQSAPRTQVGRVTTIPLPQGRGSALRQGWSPHSRGLHARQPLNVILMSA